MFQLILSFLFLAAPLMAMTSQDNIHKKVNTTELKSWYDQHKVMTVIDARTQKYFNGVLLPQAKWLPVDSNENEIQNEIPEKKNLIVIYCFSAGCPLSGELYDKLTSMGYTNVYEYREGLKEWQSKGFPTEKQ